MGINTGWLVPMACAHVEFIGNRLGDNGGTTLEYWTVSVVRVKKFMRGIWDNEKSTVEPRLLLGVWIDVWRQFFVCLHVNDRSVC